MCGAWCAYAKQKSLVKFRSGGYLLLGLHLQMGARRIAEWAVGTHVVLDTTAEHAIRLLAENFWLLPCSYKAEILIEPTFRALLAHDFAKDYYDKALPQVDGVESKSTLGGESL